MGERKNRIRADLKRLERSCLKSCAHGLHPLIGFDAVERQGVNVYIGVDGTAQRAEVKAPSGFERLDQAALATARAWRYVPGKRGGVPEAMWFSVPINFVLE